MLPLPRAVPSMTGWPREAAIAVLALLFSSLGVLVLWRFRAALPHAAPNARTLHAQPVPRVGGLAVATGLIPLVLGGAVPLAGGVALWAAAGALALVSFYDDWRGLPAAPRMVLHIVAAAGATAALLAGDTAGTPWAAAAACILAIAWSANAYNFMDGTDGLAATMAVAGFGAYAAGAAIAGSPYSAYIAITAAVVPFAVVNWPPARMFLGDCGAVPLGFLAAAAGLGEWLRGTWPGWFPLLVFLPFLADASVTLARRALRGERVWEAHRSHYYQRWHQLGAGHRGTLARYGALMAGTAISAVLTLRIEPAAGWIVLAAWGIAFGLLFLCIDRAWRLHTSNR